MKKLKVNVLILVVSVVLVGCFNSELSASEFVVHDTKLGDSHEELNERLGTPNAQKTSVINEVEYDTYEYNDVEFILLDNTVVGINSADKEFETDSGVGIGSERTTVEEAYEEQEHIKDTYGMMVKDGEILLHFVFNEDIVDSIRFSKLSEMEDHLLKDLGFDIYNSFENHTTDMKLAPLNPAEVIYEHLEESAQAETEMADLQESLTAAETNEVEWYSEMLTISSVEEIIPLADQAIESANDRRSLIENEKTLMEASLTAFQKTEPYTDDIDEENAKVHVDNLMKAMNDRYNIYLDLNEKYSQSIEEDILLYEMIKDEEVELEDLQGQHEAVNESYKLISQLHDQFNQLTNDYNDAKLAFYEAAGVIE